MTGNFIFGRSLPSASPRAERLLLAMGFGFLAGFSEEPHASALTCAPGREILTLEIREVTVDGVPQSLDAYSASPVEMSPGTTAVTMRAGSREQAFTEFTRCGAYVSEDDLQPTPPDEGAACANEGLHCHWPDAGELCAARCAGGAWEVVGCP